MKGSISRWIPWRNRNCRSVLPLTHNYWPLTGYNMSSSSPGKITFYFYHICSCLFSLSLRKWVNNFFLLLMEQLLFAFIRLGRAKTQNMLLEVKIAAIRLFWLWLQVTRKLTCDMLCKLFWLRIDPCVFTISIAIFPIKM